MVSTIKPARPIWSARLQRIVRAAAPRAGELRHRLNVDGVLSGYRDLGLVSEVFTKRVLEELPQGAKMATGHVRYATAGQRSRSNAQPMILHHCKGAMAVCHNGNLVNAPKLRRKLEMSGLSSTAPPIPR